MHLNVCFGFMCKVIMTSHPSYEGVEGCGRTSPLLCILGGQPHAGDLTERDCGGLTPQVTVSFTGWRDGL
jgi:hypothetical protein